MWRPLRWTLPLLGLAALLAWWVVPRFVSLPKALMQPLMPSVSYVARDARPLRTLLNPAGDRALPVATAKDIPELLIYATLAAEDKRFGSHGGIDFAAIARAARDNILAGRIVSGASTIHQQLIKITSGGKGKRTFVRKLEEAFQARSLALQWTRNQVITEYLNRVSYGNLLTGCRAAASGYFNKSLDDLSAAECGYLAAIPQSPTRFNPLRDPAAVLPRQRMILRKMHQLGWLDQEDLDAALAETVTIQRFTGGFAAPHAVEMLRSNDSTATLPETGQVRTTLDWFLQREVESIITGRLAALKERHVTQAAAVVIDNASGNILALAGSRDFFARDAGQINGAWAPHSPGSAMKPFTYALAFGRGATPATIVADLPIEYPTPTGMYRPENYAHRLYGPMTYRDALGNSLNISAVKVLSSIGGAETLLEKLREIGITTLTEEAEHYGLGLTIGNAPVRLIELTNAYACLARLGLDLPWTLKAGLPPAEGTRRLGQHECFLIADILSDNHARLLTFGANSPLRLPFRVAVKTGTSQSYRDNWTLGYTPEYTVGVWTGNFDNTPMQDVSGVTGAAPIWRSIFLYLHERKPPTWYAAPPGMVQRRVDPRNGKLLTPQSPPARMSREEWFMQDQSPPVATKEDYDKRGRAIVAPEYEEWIRSGDNWMGDVLTTAKTLAAAHWRISNPTPGTVIQLDPDIPDGGRRLLLRTTPPQPVQWLCGSLPIQKDDNESFVILKPGRHEFVAQDPRTGEEQRTFVIVREE